MGAATRWSSPLATGVPRRIEAETGTYMLRKNPGFFMKVVRDKASSEKGLDMDRLIFKDSYFAREYLKLGGYLPPAMGINRAVLGRFL